MYSLQLASSCLLVIVILRYLWAFWSTLEVSWNLPLFLLVVSSPIALALSAQVISVDCDSAKSPEQQYFENCRATYLFWASAPLFGIFFDSVSGNAYTLLDASARLIVVALLSSLAFTKKPSYHWFALLFLLIGLVLGMSSSQFELTNWLPIGYVAHSTSVQINFRFTYQSGSFIFRMDFAGFGQHRRFAEIWKHTRAVICWC